LTVSHATRTLIFLKRKFHVTLLEHDEGVSVSCPELAGCHSQGANVEEALANIQGAIRGYIDLYGEPYPAAKTTAADNFLHSKP
jgi:predicted RNase H-like HicB family nuclease